MAETAGLVIGAVSLAGLFTTCVDSFNYLRIGQAFADDFPIYQTELDVLELRFSRWAQAVQQLSTDKNPAITDNTARLVERNLRDIAKLFKRAREDSEEYAQEESPESLKVHDPSQPSEISKVHAKLKALVHHRQKTTKDLRLSKEFKWAIYKKDEFLELIAKVRQKVDDLEAIISTDILHTKLAQLQIEDAKEVQKETADQIKLVQDSGKDVDPVFADMLGKINPRNNYDLIDIANEAKIQMGETIAKDYNGPLSQALNSYRNIKIGSKATVNMGNLHGRTVFDQVGSA